MAPLSHFDEHGASRMVDVSGKPASVRTARASGRVQMAAATLQQVRRGAAAKGNVLEVARLAGIMGAKQTAQLIPLCHPLSLDGIHLDFAFPDDRTVAIEASVKIAGRTGVEMEALTAVTVAALTIYDMCKSVDRAIVLGPFVLEEKSGGRSGHFRRSVAGGDEAHMGTQQEGKGEPDS